MMSATKRVLAGAAGVAFVLAAGCNDEKKPPLTPDGPEMTAPIGSDGGDVPSTASTTSAAPPAK
jgi:hypothetical protein